MEMKVVAKFPGLPLLEELVEHFMMNHSRVEHLIQLYETVTKDKKGKRYSSQIDILRAAVVFIHASLEDGTRSIARDYLRFCDDETMNKIPLIDLNQSGRPEKFFLGKLVSHKEKSVEELIQESISSYLDKKSFSSVSEVSAMLDMCQIDQSKVENLYPTLEEMIKRRHHIVHKGDKSENTGPGRQYGKSLSAKKVRKWNDTVSKFFGDLCDEYVGMMRWINEEVAKRHKLDEEQANKT